MCSVREMSAVVDEHECFIFGAWRRSDKDGGVENVFGARDEDVVVGGQAYFICICVRRVEMR
jgi:hypothetical protein